MREGVMSIEDRIWVVQCLRDAVEEIRENGFGCFFPGTPLCVNYGRLGDPAGCRECFLLAYVPREHSSEALPCFRIVLDGGHSLLELCRQVDSGNLEETVLRWLSDRASDLVHGDTALNSSSDAWRLPDPDSEKFRTLEAGSLRNGCQIGDRNRDDKASDKNLAAHGSSLDGSVARGAAEES